jgi:hypothetical protein
MFVGQVANHNQVTRGTASGYTAISYTTISGVPCVVYYFTPYYTNTFTKHKGSTAIRFLAVAGGGGGGGVIGGGGGGGGWVETDVSIGNAAHSINVGYGGSGGLGWNNYPQNGYEGGNTTAFGYTAYGGGGGGAHGGADPYTPGGFGASAGGSGNYSAGTYGYIPGQGNDGGPGNSNAGGGGGGAGAAGGHGYAGGGIGRISSIDGYSRYHSGGAGPGIRYGYQSGAGWTPGTGAYGGGQGSYYTAGVDSRMNGAEYTGGGGGGGGYSGDYGGTNAGTGGVGLVVLKVPIQ